eukprot:353726-Chlamydomonas_euryale.AAC.2
MTRPSAKSAAALDSTSSSTLQGRCWHVALIPRPLAPSTTAAAVPSRPLPPRLLPASRSVSSPSPPAACACAAAAEPSHATSPAVPSSGTTVRRSPIDGRIATTASASSWAERRGRYGAWSVESWCGLGVGRGKQNGALQPESALCRGAPKKVWRIERGGVWGARGLEVCGGVEHVLRVVGSTGSGPTEWQASWDLSTKEWEASWNHSRHTCVESPTRSQVHGWHAQGFERVVYAGE